MRLVRDDGHLPALPGPRINANRLQRNGGQARCHLLSGRDHRVIFARIMQRREVLAPFDQLISDARHGGNHDSHLMAGIHLSLHAGGDIADTIQISD